jgi:hypothetical protein
LIVFDRGITSKSNQLEIEKLSWKVVCGVPIKESLKRFLRPIIADTEFVSYKNRVRLNKNVFYIVVKPYTLGEVKGTIAICFNEQQRKDLKNLVTTISMRHSVCLLSQRLLNPVWKNILIVKQKGCY